MLTEALQYLKMKRSIIPCKKDKRPIVAWADYQHTRPTTEQVKEWWGNKYKAANIGLITGEISGVDVIDCDTEEAFENFNENFMPDSVVTPIAKTPNGYHIYFKHRPGLSNAVRAISGTDLRTNGGYVIAPPSIGVNGKGYEWFKGLSLKEVEPVPMPDFVFDILKQAGISNSHLNNSISNNVKDNSNKSISILQSPCQISGFSKKGQRDDDLFHVANCLVKGGYEKDRITEVLTILARNCNPPFDEKEIPVKIKSALSRKEGSEKNLSQEIREWVLSNDVYFSSNNIQNCLMLSNRNERKLLSRVLSVMVQDGVIERVGKQYGMFRKKEAEVEPSDFTIFDETPTNLWLPFNLHRMVEIMDGNIIGVYGEVESGKTAFLLNIAKNNLNSMRVHYFNSEMGKKEFAKRLRNFEDITLKDWKAFLNFYEVEGNFHEHIRPGPGNLNIVDFLEIHKDFYLVGEMIKKIHDALKGAIAVIAIQKNPGRDDPLGGQRAMEKPRLILSISSGIVKISKAKNWAEGVFDNPRGKSTYFKLVKGCRLHQVGDWFRAD
jgi:hypothetical protein